MNILLLNSDLLSTMSNSLSILTKPQKGKKGMNYFFVPNIGVKILNAKVSWVDPFKKNLSFSINKWENHNLVLLLRNINTTLTKLYKKVSYLDLSVSPFIFEKGDYIYIRTYLPNSNKKYHITDNCGNFSIPRKDAIFDSITIYFKNIWEDDINAGFNIELKYVENNF